MSNTIAHAKLGASNAHRWLHCAGSVAAEAALPIGTEVSSVYAAEGTKAHDVAEKILNGDDMIGKGIDSDMLDFVRIYTEYVQAEATYVHDSNVLIEERVDYSDWVEGGFGTADAIVIKDNELVVVDLKYGMGIKVHAENNPQGMLYALGAYTLTEATHDIKTIKIVIVQPRLDHISEWVIGTDGLLKFGEYARERAEATREDNAPRTPGESICRWCKVKANCGALAKRTEDAMMGDFDDLDNVPNPDTLTDDQLRFALENKGLIESWLTAVQASVLAKLESGHGFPGFKMVEGRSVRKWDDIDDSTVARALGEFDVEAYAKKLITPTQAEKALGAKHKGAIADLIIKPKGKPTLAPESDKRPALNTSPGDFDVV